MAEPPAPAPGTPPASSTALPATQASHTSSGTPPKWKQSSNSSPPFDLGTSATKPDHKKAKEAMAREILPDVVGGMSIKTFFKTFLPCSDDDENCREEFLKGVRNNLFSDVPHPEPVKKKTTRKDKSDSEDEDVHTSDQKLNESDMYPSLVDHLNDLFPDSLTFVNHASTRDPNSRHNRKWAPDIGVYGQGKSPEGRPDFSKLLIPLEVKVEGSPKVFNHPKSKSGSNNIPYLPEPSSGGGEILGQLGLTLTEIFARQYRTHGFMVFLQDPDVYFIRADRSGLIVTEPINFRKESKSLAEFFWRFKKLSDAGKGLDPTVEPATEADKESIAGILSNNDEFPRDVVKIKVKYGDGERQVIAWGAMVEPDSLTGRGTRAMSVYDPTDKKLRFLKDTWRAELVDGEATILRKLHDLKVPNIPALLGGGDLYNEAYENTKYHRTVTQDFFNNSLHASDARPPDARVHHRILENFIPCSITDCENAKELMIVVRDALEAHRVAYSHNVLHRDISDNNVRLVRDPNSGVRGVLADWDLSIEFTLDKDGNMKPPEGPRQQWRTGTWRFMSALLLEELSKLHTLADDLESFFHLVLYLSLHLFPSNKSPNQIQNIMNIVFDEVSYDFTTKTYTGGSNKHRMLTNQKHIKDLTFDDNQPLTEWVNKARAAFGRFLWYLEAEDEIDVPRRAAAFNRVFRHDYIVDQLRVVLQRPDWSDKKHTDKDWKLLRKSKRSLPSDGSAPTEPLNKKQKSTTKNSKSKSNPDGSYRHSGSTGSGSGLRMTTRLKNQSSQK